MSKKRRSNTFKISDDESPCKEPKTDDRGLDFQIGNTPSPSSPRLSQRLGDRTSRRYVKLEWKFNGMSVRNSVAETTNAYCVSDTPDSLVS